MVKLTLKGFERVNDINSRYNIKFYEIDEESLQEFLYTCMWLIDNTCIISDEDEDKTWLVTVWNKFYNE